MDAVIRTFTMAPLAHAQAEWLRSHGVPASVLDEHGVSVDLLMPAVGYIKLTVPDTHAERARALLETQAPLVDVDDGAPVWTCPFCGDHERVTYHPFLWVILVPVLFPLMFIRRTVCARCHCRVAAAPAGER